eukprot:CAMPEP_0184505686 /NCGR_PEP_ID=MMETSP0113_2-20130426/53114_1 /TAXON_ID=91329 /ORGANISM="Norrisiella sphaerica, Strain BC52" /LENGTH=389 /DNA_ID=CAMNT_0026895385 /DNA_START=943 /DNA_END=2112 /DNA_ORIENTATION=-
MIAKSTDFTCERSPEQKLNRHQNKRKATETANAERHIKLLRTGGCSKSEKKQKRIDISEQGILRPSFVSLPTAVEENVKLLKDVLTNIEVSKIPPEMFQEDNQNLDSYGSEIVELQTLTTKLTQQSNSVFFEICKAMGPTLTENVPDESLFLFCKLVVTRSLSVARTAIFSTHVLLPRLRALSKPISRTLFSALHHLSMLHPKPVIHDLILPLLCSSPELNSSHGDLVKKLVKAHLKKNTPSGSTPNQAEPKSTLAYASPKLSSNPTNSSISPYFRHLLAKILEQLPQSNSKPTAEAIAAVLQDLLSKPKLFPLPPVGASGGSCERLVSWISANLQEHSKSLKVANVFLRFLQHHPRTASGMKVQLILAADLMESFMKKTIKNKIRALQ